MWRLNYEQLIYSHLDTDQITKQPRYLLDTANMRILAGRRDNYAWADICSATVAITGKMRNTPGEMSVVENSGHSIHNEWPALLAGEIRKFVLNPIAGR